MPNRRHILLSAILLLVLALASICYHNCCSRSSRNARLMRAVKAVGGSYWKNVDGIATVVVLRNIDDNRPLGFLQLSRDEIRSVSLRGSQVRSNDTLRSMGVLPHVFEIVLADGSYQTILPAQQFPALVRVSIWKSTISDSVLSELSGTRLKDLVITDSSISDRCMQSIGRAASLERIKLRGNQHITDHGLACLGDLPTLRLLILETCNIDGSGFSAFSSNSKLEYLSVFETRLSSTSCKHISKFAGLWGLDIGSTNVTDSGVSELSALSRLRMLVLPTSAITENSVRVLETMPHLCRLTVLGGGLKNAKWFPDWQKQIHDYGVELKRTPIERRD